MEKYRQYRMMKKVRKLLDAPAKQEEVYTPSNNLYLSRNDLTTKDNVLDPDRRMRMTHVEDVAQLLLQHIGRLEELHTGVLSQIDGDLRRETDGISKEIDILFEELDQGILLTEAEKDNRTVDGARSKYRLHFERTQTDINFGALRNRVHEWQQEKNRRKKKLNRLESSIRELSLNVNDVRCTHILRDRKTSLAALESAIDMGEKVLREVFRDAQIARGTLDAKR
jgi:hypothetical protein